jgi:hypothetical protein
MELKVVKRASTSEETWATDKMAANISAFQILRASTPTCSIQLILEASTSDSIVGGQNAADTGLYTTVALAALNGL